MRIEQQLHAYVNGHELLASSVKLESRDQETVDRLSDMAGTLGPGERCPSYLTGYPLPSRSHFVLARTWNDDAAPRAGCVLTQSLLVPMDMWRVFERVAALRDAFAEFDKKVRRRALDPLRLPPGGGEYLRPVFSPERLELAEAIFLEQRTPIVAFDCLEPEPAALRLIQAMWPALRESFAFCTFTLQPRSVDGRDFDLLFCPSGARSRFAKWAGRRIDPHASHRGQPRHRWSELLARSIFEDDVPRLLKDDPLGILQDDVEGNSDRLRLALLWQDLRQREAESPSAVLGMLDVLASMGFMERELRRRADPLIVRAAERAGREMPPDEGLRFLALLVGKLPSGRPNGRTLGAIQSAASRLAYADSAAAFAAVPSEGTLFLGARTIARGIGDGLAKRGTFDLLHVLSAAPHDAITHLLDASPSLCRAVVPTSYEAPASWWATLASVLAPAAPAQKRRLRRRMLPLLRESAHACLIRPLLSGLTAIDVAPSFTILWRAVDGSGATEFERALVEVLLPIHRELLRDAILRLPPDIQLPEQLLLRVLRPTTEDLSRLLTSERVEAWRQASIIGRFLESLTDGELEHLAQDAHVLIEQSVVLLADESPPGAPRQIARLLCNVHLGPDTALRMMLKIIDSLDQDDAFSLMNGVLPEILRTSDVFDMPMIGSLLGTTSAIEASLRMGSARLLDSFVPVQRKAFDGARQSAVLELVQSLPRPTKHILLERIDDLTRRLANRDGDELTPSAFHAWAQLLDEARKDGARNALRAEVVSVRYAFERRPRGASGLVLAAFPAVYEAASSKEPSLDVDSLFSFLDWDRAKTLRIQLISTYTRSDWAPGDLMVVAERSRIGRKVLKRLTREPRGDQYIARMKADLLGRSDANERRAYEQIVHFEHNPPGRYEWD